MLKPKMSSVSQNCHIFIINLFLFLLFSVINLKISSLRVTYIAAKYSSLFLWNSLCQLSGCTDRWSLYCTSCHDLSVSFIKRLYLIQQPSPSRVFEPINSTSQHFFSSIQNPICYCITETLRPVQHFSGFIWTNYFHTNWCGSSPDLYLPR